METHQIEGDMPEPATGARICIHHKFDSGMIAQYEGEVTHVGLQPRLSGHRYVQLDNEHYFLWGTRVAVSGQWCKVTFDVLTLPEPDNLTVWKVNRRITGLTFFEVWVRCDDPARHWTRAGDNGVYTWTEVCDKLRSQNGGVLPELKELV